MSSFFGLYMIFAALFTVLFSPITVAAPAGLEKRDYSGKATYFEVGLGACGQTNVNSDYIVAINPTTYANGAHCGKKLRITDKATGEQAVATVRDKCPGCGVGDLDLSPSLFSHFENLDKGTFQIEWEFL